MDPIAYDVKYLALRSGKEERFVVQKGISEAAIYTSRGDPTMAIRRGLTQNSDLVKNQSDLLAHLPINLRIMKGR